MPKLSDRQREYERTKKSRQYKVYRANGMRPVHMFAYPGHLKQIKEYARKLMQEVIDTGIVPPEPLKMPKKPKPPPKRKSWERAPDAPTSGRTWRIVFPKKPDEVKNVSDEFSKEGG